MDRTTGYKNILITGANFNNKGAQSMLFITVDELRKRFPAATIYFSSAKKTDMSVYNFNYIYSDINAQSIALEMNVPIVLCKVIFKNLENIICRHSESSWKVLELKRTLKDIDLMVDISGYNLGNKWNVLVQERYLNNIRLAHKYSIPIYLMPQSFGPFDYSDEKKYLIREILEELSNCALIFAREKEGYQDLINTFHLNNVVLSSDLVLQNKSIDFKNIYKKLPKLDIPKIQPGSVGIVPNKQCFDHGEKKKNLDIYKAVIEKILEKGKKVYIFRHSNQDLEMCLEIYNLCNGRVELIENDFSCLEYDKFVQQFDFIICSRYHGNVHAYRNCIPSILLGWAVKYRELAELVGQGEYAFDITDDKLKVSDIVDATEKMCRDYKKEGESIKLHLETVQKDNCFEKAFG